jgi:AraC-like DNA-binding protein
VAARDEGDGLAQVCEFIARHHAKRLTIDVLARRAGLSKFHFIRSFTARTGQTPHQYLRAKRIDRACHLLATTPMPISDVCEACGFESLSSFSGVFRRLTGETPAAYRAARRRNVLIPSCFVRMFRMGK